MKPFVICGLSFLFSAEFGPSRYVAVEEIQNEGKVKRVHDYNWIVLIFTFLMATFIPIFLFQVFYEPVGQAWRLTT